MTETTATRATRSRLYLPPWRIDVEWRAGVARLLPGVVLARAVARSLHVGAAPPPASVGLFLSDDRELSLLNESAMTHSGPTDVLSFPLLAPSQFPTHDGQDPAVPKGSDWPEFKLPPGQRRHLGDIVISVERAIEQAESGHGGHAGTQRWSPAEELLLLVTHGALHLCGWDHELPAEAAAMRVLERQLLSLGP